MVFTACIVCSVHGDNQPLLVCTRFLGVLLCWGVVLYARRMKVIIHCSASNFGNAALIDSWHRQKGFSRVGYHFVILNGMIGHKKYHDYFDGAIETGRPLDDDSDMEPDEVGAHTLGHNKSVGICLVGESAMFTPKQMKSLNILLSILKSQFGSIEVFQHSDFEPKKPFCAGISKPTMKLLNEI